MISSASLGAARFLAADSAVFDLASMLTTAGSTNFATSANESESRVAAETVNCDLPAGSFVCAAEVPKNTSTDAAIERLDPKETHPRDLFFILLGIRPASASEWSFNYIKHRQTRCSDTHIEQNFQDASCPCPIKRRYAVG
jgi:hypothetical protein